MLRQEPQVAQQPNDHVCTKSGPSALVEVSAPLGHYGLPHMGGSRGMLPVMVTLTIVAIGCGGDTNAGVTASQAPGSEATVLSSAIPEPSSNGDSDDGSHQPNPSWCRPAIDDLIAAGLEAVDDGVRSQLTGQPAYAVDACYWSAAGLFVGRQLSRGSLDYHRSEDEMIGPWKDLPGLGEGALASTDVGWVFWIRDGNEYAIGSDGRYCFRHKQCKPELIAAAKLIDQRLASG
jgi:hypothetical protein